MRTWEKEMRAKIHLPTDRHIHLVDQGATSVRQTFNHIKEFQQKKKTETAEKEGERFLFAQFERF